MIEERSLSAELGRRVQEIRGELYGEGESGLQAISDLMAVSGQTWRNFEQGVAVPAGLLLHFLAVSRVNPHWLRTGSGSRFLAPPRTLAGQDVEAGSQTVSQT